MSINVSTILGCITKDLELKTTPNGICFIFRLCI